MSTKYKGTGVIASGDFHNVTWTGRTKAGNSVVITLKDALNMGNIDWTFAEKDDVVAQVVMTGTYSNTDAMALEDDDYEEPWSIEFTSGTGEAGNIILGAGVFSIGGVDIALTRGGGSFKVEREFRQINADGDRGPVKGRVVIDAATATLTMNALQILTHITSLYPAITEVTG